MSHKDKQNDRATQDAKPHEDLGVNRRGEQGPKDRRRPLA